MKYSVLGFNQEKVMQTDLDLTDLMILNYIMTANGSPRMSHRLTEEEHPIVWISHAKLSEDLPILRITEGTLRNRLNKLKQGGYIESEVIANANNRGTKAYYGLTELTMSLIYDMENTTTSRKNDMEELPRHAKMTSNKSLNFNNKLNNTISKDIVSETEPKENPSNHSLRNIPKVNDSDEYVSKEYSKEDFKEENKKKESKPKGLNLYQKCVNLTNEFTDDEELKKLLDIYLRMRLSMKDKPMYGVNQWRGMLHKLEVSGGDMKENVQYCTERGYASFYAPQKYGYGNNRKIDKSVFGENDDNKTVKVTKEEIENGYFSGQVF